MGNGRRGTRRYRSDCLATLTLSAASRAESRRHGRRCCCARIQSGAALGWVTLNVRPQAMHWPRSLSTVSRRLAQPACAGRLKSALSLALVADLKATATTLLDFDAPLVAPLGFTRGPLAWAARLLRADFSHTKRPLRHPPSGPITSACTSVRVTIAAFSTAVEAGRSAVRRLCGWAASGYRPLTLNRKARSIEASQMEWQRSRRARPMGRSLFMKMARFA